MKTAILVAAALIAAAIFFHEPQDLEAQGSGYGSNAVNKCILNNLDKARSQGSAVLLVNVCQALNK